MGIIKDNLKVAMVGTISGTLPIKAIFEFHKPSTIILNGHYGRVPEQAREWSETNRIPVKEISVHYPSSGFPSTEDYKEAATKLVEEADVVLIFYDYIPSKYSHYYPKPSPVLDGVSQIIKDVAESLGKPVELHKVEAEYHFEFMIKEWDNDISPNIFTIDIKSSDAGTENYAKAVAIAEAKIRYIQYIHRCDSKYTFWLKITERRNYRDYWVDIDTADIEKWYDAQIKQYNKIDDSEPTEAF